MASALVIKSVAQVHKKELLTKLVDSSFFAHNYCPFATVFVTVA